MSDWKPVREPIQVTLRRTVPIALLVGAVIALPSGGLARWPLASLLALWFSLGGHWVELLFLNWLRPRLSVARAVQVGSRLAVWWVGGTALAFGMALTAAGLAGKGFARWPAWYVGGFAFVLLELAVHWGLQLRGRPSFYNGQG